MDECKPLPPVRQRRGRHRLSQRRARRRAPDAVPGPRLAFHRGQRLWNIGDPPHDTAGQILLDTS